MRKVIMNRTDLETDSEDEVSPLTAAMMNYKLKKKGYILIRFGSHAEMF
jgi:hypothetical protein